MLRRQDMPFRMRHEAENAAGDIAQAGNVALAAIGIGRIGRGAFWSARVEVAKNGLPRLQKSLEVPVEPADKSPLAVRDGDMEPVDAFEKGTVTRMDGEVNPAILELAGAVLGQRGDGTILIGGND